MNLNDWNNLSPAERDGYQKEMTSLLSNLPIGELDLDDAVTVSRTADGVFKAQTGTAAYFLREANSWRVKDLGGGVIEFSQYKDGNLIDRYVGRGDDIT